MLHEYLVNALDIIVETSTTDAYAEDETAGASSNPFGGNNNAGGSSSTNTLDAAGDSVPTPEASPMAGGGSHGAQSTLGTPVPVQGLTPQASMMLHIEGTKMSELLRPPGIPLNIESTCMALNERIVAAESCCFIAMVSCVYAFF